MPFSRSRILETLEHSVHQPEERKLVISPFDESMVGGPVVDLHIGPYFRYFPDSDEELVLTREFDYIGATQFRVCPDGYTIAPKGFVLGVTAQEVQIPQHLAGRLYSRSWSARAGLETQTAAQFIQPGSRRHIVLEIVNGLDQPVRVVPGTSYCQLEITELDGNPNGFHTGNFHKQRFFPEDFEPGKYDLATNTWEGHSDWEPHM